MAGESGGSQLSEKAQVEAVLRDLMEAAERWEALVAEAETTTYSVDTGEISAVADSDGQLLDLTLHPSVVSRYTHHELTERLNIAFGALREAVHSDYLERYGPAVSPDDLGEGA